MELLESLNKVDSDDNENGKKTIGLDCQKTHLHVHHAFVPYISWSSLPSTVWNFLISRFTEDVITRQRLPFSFCELRYSPSEFNSWKKINNIWQIKRDGIRAKKFETAQIHFLCDVFAAVAAIVSELLLKPSMVKWSNNKRPCTIAECF